MRKPQGSAHLRTVFYQPYASAAEPYVTACLLAVGLIRVRQVELTMSLSNTTENNTENDIIGTNSTRFLSISVFGFYTSDTKRVENWIIVTAVIAGAACLCLVIYFCIFCGHKRRTPPLCCKQNPKREDCGVAKLNQDVATDYGTRTLNQ